MRLRPRQTQRDGRERYWEQIKEMRETLGLSHQEARRQWSNYYRHGGQQIKPLRRLQLAIKASTVTSTTCPFCRDEIVVDEPDYTCSCGAHYHADCFADELNGRCAMLGCSVRHVVRRTERARRLRTPERREPSIWTRPLPYEVVTFLLALGVPCIMVAVVYAILMLTVP